MSMSLRQEPPIKQEPLDLPSASQPYQPPFYQGSTYSSSSSPQYGPQSNSSLQHPTPPPSGTSVAPFSNLPPTSSYNLNRHLIMNMHNHAVSSANVASGGNSAAGSGAPTPVIPNAHLPNGLSSTPSSPNLNGLQYPSTGTNTHFGSSGHGNNSNGNSGNSSPYIQHHSQSLYQGQNQQHSYIHQPAHSSDPNSSGYYNSSPPYGSQYQQQQQPQPGSQQHGGSGANGSGPHVQFSSTTPSPMRQHQPQYASLVPPLSDSQYAQYHQLLGSSAFSSAQSTPYHSNHSTPYSSMPGSPTRDYHPLNETQLTQKPKRRQVKNACVNCQKACKKCDEGRPCARCIKYGLTDTCVDSTRKVRKKGIKRGPYKRRVPANGQAGSASSSTTPTMRNAVPTGVPGYMSEPVTALSSPTQSHMLPFSSAATSATLGQISTPLDFGYDTSGGPNGYSFHSQRIEPNYAPPYTTGYSGSNLYAPTYVNSGGNNGNGNSANMP
ncbi:hypothetical protein BGX34_000840 [Mortierella sp. NVP85]|nr:hypothetical protein BGX34_000840 [Mortierella sp. NVP85]